MHALRAFYPSLARPDAAAAVSDARLGDAFSAFRDFCLSHAAEVAALLAARGTQTNDVRRCAALLPALHLVGEWFGRPVGLLELGCSAGLNLLLDRYRYAFGAGLELGNPSSPVLIPCEARGALRLPLPPTVPVPAWATGVDLAPVDVQDEDTARWLRAFVWPEQTPDLRRLDAAITVARARPPRLVCGSAVEQLAPLAGAAPPEAVPCVFHTTLATYLGPAQRASLHEAIAGLGGMRDLAWIFLEAAGLMAGPGGVAAITAEDARDQRALTLGMVVFRSGRRSEHVLAQTDAYGRWIRWLDPETAAHA